MDFPWLLTPDRLREFLAAATEGVPETDVSERDIGHFGTKAIRRATSEAAVGEYKLYGYLARELAGEPEDEQIDAGNYALFQFLKDRYAVELGQLDPVKAEESEMRLRALMVQIIRLHAAWEDYWAWRYGD
jgi:hypothetical protein